MSEDPKVVVPIKPNVTEEVRKEILDVAAKASDDDKRRVAEIIAKAKAGKFLSETFVITAPMAAILFLEHNPHNRDWRAEGNKSCREYARRMKTGQWKRNNATIGFYVDGSLEDGQHRLSGAAVAGHTLEIIVVFGIERDAIITVDDLGIRHGDDHAKLIGIQQATLKQSIIKMNASYLKKVANASIAPMSEGEVYDAIKANNAMLDTAIEIGTNSLKKINEPTLKATSAQALAYLMLTHAWPAQRIREKLALFQQNVDAEGENTPYFLAGQAIRTARKKSDAQQRLSGVKELGVAVHAMVVTETGVKAIQKNAFKAAVKKELPDPTYPADKAEVKAA